MTWQRLRRGTVNPAADAVMMSLGNSGLDEVWSNDVYEVQVRYLSEDGLNGMVHLSIKTWERDAIRDWRHLQSIKNEVCGPQREAVELFPAEKRLVDGSNQFHLWVFPRGMVLPIGWHEGRAVGTEAEMQRELRSKGLDPGKGRQRDWEPGLFTGPIFNRRSQ